MEEGASDFQRRLEVLSRPPVTRDLTAGPRAAPAVAQAREDPLGAFLSPILDRLEAVADNRLGRTFLATIGAILTFCVAATLESL